MGTGIEWTDRVWNPVIGCRPVSPGCLNCYAAGMSRRHRMNPAQPAYHDRLVNAGTADAPKLVHLPIVETRGGNDLESGGGGGRAVFTGDVRCLPERLTEPLRWRKPARVFVNSMSDLFYGDEADRLASERAGVPFTPVPFEFIDRVFAVMALCPHLQFQVLTKRAGRMAEYLARGPMPIKDAALLWFGEEMVYPWPYSNVWLGTSVENQATADERIPHLLKCPAAVRFLSCEPLLGEVKLPRRDDDGQDIPRKERREWGLPAKTISTSDAPPGAKIDWVIVGGESGALSKIRPCDVAWIGSMVGQCKAAGVPVFVKQLGAWPTEVARREPSMTMAWRHDDGGENVERWYRPKDRKGGEISEWPEVLRVREMPGEGKGVSPRSTQSGTERRGAGAR